MNQHPFEQALAQIKPELLNDQEFLQELYAALCNTFWLRKDRDYNSLEENEYVLINQDGEEAYSCSWRYAGGVADDLDRAGKVGWGRNYLEYYCSGGEGTISPRVAQELSRLGWIHRPR